MRFSDLSGREYQLTNGIVWQFEHVEDGSLNKILNADCLFAVYRVVHRCDGKNDCRFVIDQINLPNRSYTLETLKEEVDFSAQLKMEGTGYQLHGLVAGDVRIL